MKKKVAAAKPRAFLHQRDRYIYNDLQRRSGAIAFSSSRGGEYSYEKAELQAGRLVTPFDLELPEEAAYYFVAPEATADQPKVVAFRAWLVAEVASAETA